MFRVYCELGPDRSHRYYRTKTGMWSMWHWDAQPLRQSEALQIAESEGGQIEPM